MESQTFFEEFATRIHHYAHIENRGIEDIFGEIRAYAENMTPEEQAMIEASYDLGKKAHAQMSRGTDVPYFTHPLAIACMMLPYEPDAILLCATLLHDTIEDTGVTFEELAQIHPDIAQVVEGVTKIRDIYSKESSEGLSREQAQFETIRKILITAQKDIRILFLKIFDRLHNMSTLGGKSETSRRRIARETMDIYAPLAKRIGLRKVSHLLNGLSLRELEPERWTTLSTFVDHHTTTLRERSRLVQEFLTTHWGNIIVRADTEFLSPFSIERSHDFSEDEWAATRVVVSDVASCYTLLHGIAKKQDPSLILCGPINDIIMHPRLSGYTGIHTHVILGGTRKIKLRIITASTAMLSATPRSFAELQNIYVPVLFRDFDLINEATLSNSEAFIESVREHILARKITLHSAKRTLFYLPAGMTLLDSLIYLEPESFSSIIEARVNHEKVPLDTVLKPDDIITYETGAIQNQKMLNLTMTRSGISDWRIRHCLEGYGTMT